MKETGPSVWNSVNKFPSQIKKPPHRRSSPPLNWFPRKSTDSFLKRKLRLLQEGDGISLSLVETLGNANPHYTRIAREKIAAQEAASKAMEARKAAMVEASWCRILQAARIQSKEAESNLERAEKHASGAFEEAKLLGAMMFDTPDCPVREVGGKSAHTINASFETEFEVDREVAAAIKKALTVLANCYSSPNKEFGDLLLKIRQNPDEDDEAVQIGVKQIHLSNRKSCHEGSCSNLSDDLVNKMVDRLKGLREDELSSLAAIVATCGLNAALLEMKSNQDHVARGGPQRRSNVNQFVCESKKKNECVTNVPSLDKFLVKHVSRLEKEVQEAQISKKNEELHRQVSRDDPAHLKQIATSEPTSDLGSILIKHVSRLEREIQEAKKSQKQKQNSAPFSAERHSSNHELVIAGHTLTLPSECSDLHKLLADKEEETSQNLALELRETKNGNLSISGCNNEASSCDVRANSENREAFSCNGHGITTDFENSSLDKILVKPVHWSEMEKKLEMDEGGVPFMKKNHRRAEKVEPLDEILVKHQSKLEKAKLAAVQDGSDFVLQKKGQLVQKIESLGDILVKHLPTSGRVKLDSSQCLGISIKHVDARREARERELQEAWGGLSLGNSLKPHLSKLEKVKADWRRAEEEEKSRGRGFSE